VKSVGHGVKEGTEKATGTDSSKPN
jgi:hypothetical protein